MADYIDIENELRGSKLYNLDLSMFDQNDLVNFILQRSAVLYDVNSKGRVIRAWHNGDMGPILREVERLGVEIAFRTAALIKAEYRILVPFLRELSPKRIADIGCGYAFFDLFAAQQFDCGLLLIDTESNQHRHFGYAEEGSAYSSLEKAKVMLKANGIDGRKITTINPAEKDVLKASKVDLAVSFLACGFHFPAATYHEFFQKKINVGGEIILDFRTSFMAEQLTEFSKIGFYPAKELDSVPRVQRVILNRDAK